MQEEGNQEICIYKAKLNCFLEIRENVRRLSKSHREPFEN